MSDKLSGLDKLIMEMMLQEKEFKVNLGGKKTVVPDLTPATKNQIISPGQAPDTADLEDLAGQRPPNNELTAKDLAVAFNSKGPVKKAADDFKDNAKSPTHRKAAGSISQQVDLAKKLSIKDKERKQQLKALGVTAADYGDVATEKDLVGDIVKGEKPPMDLWRELNDLTIDPSVKQIVKAVKGDTIVEKLLLIQEQIDAAVERKKLGRDFQTVASMANALLFVQMMGDLISEMEATAAGTAMEAVLALLAEGVVVGGKSGAVDVLAGGENETFLSSKLLKSTEVTQAMGGETGIEAVVKDGRTIRYIVGLKAEGSLEKAEKNKELSKLPSEIKSIYFYVLDVEFREFASDALKHSRKEYPEFLKDIGSKKGNIYSVKIFDGKDYHEHEAGSIPQLASFVKKGKKNVEHISLKGAMEKAMADGLYAAKIQIFDPSKNLKNNTAWLNSLVDEDLGEAMARLSRIHKRLQNMQYNTHSYVARVAQKKKGESVSDATKANLLAIRDDYTSLKEEYNQTAKNFGSLDKGDKTFLENKKNLLDKLIEEVILSTTMEE